MNDAEADALPPLAQLFLHVVNFVLPRDAFAGDVAALLRLVRVRKNLLQQMHECSGAFALDLHLSAKNIVMVALYPACELAFVDAQHFAALKHAATRFQSVGALRVDLQQLPDGCNFVNTKQILELVFHCLRAGRAKHLHISHAIFNALHFTTGMQHLFASTKDRILSINLSHCLLDIDSSFLRELASMRNLRQLTLDGNRFHRAYAGFASFSDKLESLSLASCYGVRPWLLKKMGRSLHTLVLSGTKMREADRPTLFAWVGDSRLQSLDIDDCGFCLNDIEAFEAAFARMPCLLSLSIAYNQDFENVILWWIYEHWRGGHVLPSFRLHVSNMHVCFPDYGSPVFTGTSHFNRMYAIES